MSSFAFQTFEYVIKDADETSSGDDLRVRLAKGALDVRVR